MIVFFKRNTFGYFRVIFTPFYCIFLLFGASESNLRRFFSPENSFDFDSIVLFFPLPSALNIHKAPLTGPLSVIASLIISLLQLPVISLVQPTFKPLRRKDLSFFFFQRIKVDPFFLCTMSLIQSCLVRINYGSFWICFSYFNNSSEIYFSPRDYLWLF